MVGRRVKGVNRDLNRVLDKLEKDDPKALEKQLKAIKDNQQRIWEAKFKENPIKALFPTMKDKKTDG